MSARNDLNGDDEKGDDYDDEELDPRVQEELEHLNTCTDEINQVKIKHLLTLWCSSNDARKTSYKWSVPDTYGDSFVYHAYYTENIDI